MTHAKQLTIRRLSPTDRAEWDVLWQGYLTFYKHSLVDDVTSDVFSRLTSDDPHFVGLGAFDAKARLIGTAHYVVHRSTWTTGWYCYLEDLFVAPENRGSGAARALIEEIYRRADEAGWSRVYWTTQDHNATARLLYDRIAGLTEFLVYERT